MEKHLKVSTTIIHLLDRLSPLRISMVSGHSNGSWTERLNDVPSSVIHAVMNIKSVANREGWGASFCYKYLSTTEYLKSR